jgi:hypothetical protein
MIKRNAAALLLAGCSGDFGESTAPVCPTRVGRNSMADVPNTEPQSPPQADNSSRTLIQTAKPPLSEGMSVNGQNPPPNSPYRDILLTLMGIVGTAWAGIISFYFGSSVGARAQSDTLQQIRTRRPHGPTITEG